jgi:prepilin-type N-terminal cleavage/methylation domain-containing protein
MRRAFTLLEVLTCISIIVTVSAVSYPAFQAVKQYAKRNSAASNLKQLYLATAIYRSECGGDGIYGDAAEMGLPTASGPFPTPFNTFMQTYQPFWKSPCGLNQSWFPLENGQTEGPEMEIIYRPADASTFGSYAAVYRENSLLFYDVNCDDSDAPIDNKYLDHRGIAVLVEGQLVTPYKPGLMLGNDSWWSSPAGG